MVRKWFLLTVILLTLCFTASAEENVLPEIPAAGQSILPKIELPIAVSFGDCMGIEPFSMQHLSNGQWQESYTDVTIAQYDQFGALLGDMGITAGDATMTSTTVSLMLYQGNIAIEFSYNFGMQVLTMTYPSGVHTALTTATPPSLSEQFAGAVGTLENSISGLMDDFLPQYDTVDPFRDHQEIHLGSEIVMTNSEGTNFLTHVKMRVTPLELHDNAPRVLVAEEDENLYVDQKQTSNLWLDALITNISPAGNSPAYLNNSILGTTGIYLHYINDDGHYVYNCEIGRPVNEHQVSLGYAYTSAWSSEQMVHPYSLGSLDTDRFALCFMDVPEAVQHTVSGTLAVTFASTGGDKYVLYLRK